MKGAHYINKFNERKLKYLWVSLFSITNFFIFYANASFAESSPTISKWSSPFVHDKTNGIDSYITNKKIGSKLIPFDIKFSGKPRIYKSIRPTTAYYWPIINEKFKIFRLGCGISCGLKIFSECEVVSSDGKDLIAFRDNIDSIFEYVPREDFTVESK